MAAGLRGRASESRRPHRRASGRPDSGPPPGAGRVDRTPGPAGGRLGGGAGPEPLRAPAGGPASCSRACVAFICFCECGTLKVYFLL